MLVITGRPKCSSNVELTMTCCTISGRNKVSESRTRLHKEAKKRTAILRSAEFGACRVSSMLSMWQGALQIFQHCDRERWAKRGLGRNVVPMMLIHADHVFDLQEGIPHMGTWRGLRVHLQGRGKKSD